MPFCNPNGIRRLTFPKTYFPSNNTVLVVKRHKKRKILHQKFHILKVCIKSFQNPVSECLYDLWLWFYANFCVCQYGPKKRGGVKKNVTIFLRGDSKPNWLKVPNVKNHFCRGLKTLKIAWPAKKSIFSKSEISLPQSNHGKRNIKLMLVRP